MVEELLKEEELLLKRLTELKELIKTEKYNEIYQEVKEKKVIFANSEKYQKYKDLPNIGSLLYKQRVSIHSNHGKEIGIGNKLEKKVGLFEISLHSETYKNTLLECLKDNMLLNAPSVKEYLLKYTLYPYINNLFKNYPIILYNTGPSVGNVLGIDKESYDRGIWYDDDELNVWIIYDTNIIK